jgi:mannose-6-phosphate isomerase-like protein (cupin superfamily)
MGYRVVNTDDLEPAPDRPCEMRPVTAAAELERMAVNRYVARPGEQIPLMYHYHDEQEELFYVVSGTLHVETPEETYELGPDEAFAADPESPHRAYVPEDADEPANVIAVGAPPVRGDAREYEP